MLRNNVIYVDTICLFGLQGWSSDSINVASLSRANLLLRPKGVFVKRSMHSRIRSLLLSPSVVTSLRKKFPLTPIPLCHDPGDLLCHAISVRIANVQEAPLETWLEFSLNLWPIIAKSPLPQYSSFSSNSGALIFGHVMRILFKPVTRQFFVKSPFSQNSSDANFWSSLRASSPGRSGGWTGKGRRTCNYVSGIWILPPIPLWLPFN